MRAGRQVRTVFVGFGVSGSLLAAVGAAFVIVGGVLAFDTWPSELAAPPVDSVQVAAATATARPAAVAAVNLPAAAAPAAPAPGAATSQPGPGDNAGPDGAPPRNTRPGENPAGQVPATPTPAAPATPAEVARADTALAGAVESATASTAATVHRVGTALPIAAPVTDLVGGLVDSTGRTVGGLLRGLGGG
jgi:hypothetical protein